MANLTPTTEDEEVEFTPSEWLVMIAVIVGGIAFIGWAVSI